MLYPGTARALAWALLAAAVLPAAARAQAPLGKANAESSPDVRLEVTELKRTSGDTVTLKALIVNGSAKTFSPPSMSRVYLINAGARTKYSVLKDERGRAVASAGHNVKAGERQEIWAKFSAPPAGVQKLTLIVPKFSPLEDLPLGR